MSRSSTLPTSPFASKPSRFVFVIGTLGALIFTLGVKAMESLEPIEDTSLLIEHIDDNKLRVHGREWDARVYCTPESIANSDLVRAYRLRIPEGESLVVHCPGVMDGDLNRVSVFTSGQKPRSLSLKPLPSSHSISDAKLIETVTRLMAAPAPAKASDAKDRRQKTTPPKKKPVRKKLQRATA